MNQEKLDNKVRGSRKREKGIYLIILERINSLEKKDKKVIPFPRVFSKLCPSLQINKSQAWEILFLLSDLGLIKIVFGHGISIIKGGAK